MLWNTYLTEKPVTRLFESELVQKNRLVFISRENNKYNWDPTTEDADPANESKAHNFCEYKRSFPVAADLLPEDTAKKDLLDKYKLVRNDSEFFYRY